MSGLLKNTVGILPAGALGVSFFYHLTDQLRRVDQTVYFLQRRGSTGARLLREQSILALVDENGPHQIPTADVFRGEITTCFKEDELSEVLLVCPNPDQLLSAITDLVELLEEIFDTANLEGHPLPFPIVVLCSNGIYFQRVRQFFIEKIEESVLLGRLPDLWPDWMPKIIGRLLRGVTFQTGIREGFGPNTIYHPGLAGITKIAGGDASCRERCCLLLSAKGGWFEAVNQFSPTRLEFDKAIVNLASNLLGQIYAIDDEGNFTPLTIKELLAKGVEEEIGELCKQVLEVGKAVKVYGPNDVPATVFSNCMESLRQRETHIPSSLQWVNLKIRQGNLQPELTPTEIWLLTPLLKYAKAAGLDSASLYFEHLEALALKKLTLAAKAYHRI